MLRHTAFLTAGEARKLGLFKPFKGRLRLSSLGILVERVGSNTLRFHVPVDPDVSDDFPLDDGRFWAASDVVFKWRSLHFGKRPFFVCPVTEKSCLKLLFYRGIACSKRVFSAIVAADEHEKISGGLVELRARLRAFDGGSRRLSSRTQQRFYDDLRALEGKDPVADKRLERERKRLERNEEKRLWEARTLSTTKAIDCGPGINQYRHFLVMLERPKEWFADPHPPVAICHSKTPALMTDFPELDIRILIERGRFSADRLTGSRLGWPETATSDSWVLMYVIPAAIELPTLIMEFWSPGTGQSLFQKIDLLGRRGSNRPRYFLCPVTRTRCDVLYLRNGFFASREAHFLRFPPGGKKGVTQAIRETIPKGPGQQGKPNY